MSEGQQGQLGWAAAGCLIRGLQGNAGTCRAAEASEMKEERNKLIFFGKVKKYSRSISLRNPKHIFLIKKDGRLGDDW